MTTQEQEAFSFFAVVEKRKQMTGVELQLQEKEAEKQLLLKNLKLLVEDIENNENEMNELKSKKLKTNEFSLLGRMNKFAENKENAAVNFFSGQIQVSKIILTHLYDDDSDYIRTLWLTCKSFSFFVSSTCKLVSYSKPASNSNAYFRGFVDEAWDHPQWVPTSPLEICFEWEPTWVNLDTEGFKNETTKKRKAEIDLENEAELGRFTPTRPGSPYVPTSPLYSPPTSP